MSIKNSDLQNIANLGTELNLAKAKTYKVLMFK